MSSKKILGIITLRLLAIFFIASNLVVLNIVFAEDSKCASALDGDWKLVRDELPNIYAQENDPTVVRQIKPSELKKYLLNKLSEEIEEFRENPSSEEMADILEVLLAIQFEFGLDRDQIEAIRIKKLDKKGGFKKGYIIPSIP